jgi:hypothetical protein
MTIDRKAAAAAFKERKTLPGVYAIRCPAAGGLWLGQASDMTRVQNRHWFALRTGGHTNRAMQAAWASHGETGFSFEMLEILAEEDNSIILGSQLRDALKRWRMKLVAEAVYPRPRDEGPSRPAVGGPSFIVRRHAAAHAFSCAFAIGRGYRAAGAPGERRYDRTVECSTASK